MTGKQAIVTLMKRHSIRNCEIYNRLGISRATFFCRIDQKRTDNLTVRVMVEILNILGYKLLVVPKRRVVADGEIQIDNYVKKTE